MSTWTIFTVAFCFALVGAGLAMFFEKSDDVDFEVDEFEKFQDAIKRGRK